MSKASNLNPLASTFIPSSVTKVATEAEELNSDPEVFASNSSLIRSVAANFSEKVMTYKKERGENSITKIELLNIVLRVIVLKHNITSNPELVRAAYFLMNRIPSEPLSIKEKGEPSSYCKTNRGKYDFSVWRKPAQTILLVAFYGLYRQEQAFRPLLSLTRRPKVFQDSVWSITDKDLKLWNPCVVQPCSCPPMFGYHIPVNFFGNPFKLSYSCPKKKIHLCRSKESSKGTEFTLLDRPQNDEIVEMEFVDFEEKIDLDPRSDLNCYSKQMKEIVSTVYRLIDDYDTVENVTENSIDDATDEGYFSCYLDSLWDTNDSEFNTKSDKLYEDDHHPLLDVELATEDSVEDVPMEIKELLRRSFSNEWDIDVAPSFCDPPCSVWCSDLERSNFIQNRRKSDFSAIDLLNETTQLLTDISSYPKTQATKPSFKRSYSENDCDYCQNSWPLPFLMRDPVDFNSRRSSYDSGIMSSQEEDVPCEEWDEGSSVKAPMWTLFSGEHSLWKPLPGSEESKLAPKRARGLKRQTSN